MADALPYIESEKLTEADANISSPKKLITAKSVNKTKSSFK